MGDLLFFFKVDLLILRDCTASALITGSLTRSVIGDRPSHPTSRPLRPQKRSLLEARGGMASILQNHWLRMNAEGRFLEGPGKCVDFNWCAGRSVCCGVGLELKRG